MTFSEIQAMTGAKEIAPPFPSKLYQGIKFCPWLILLGYSLFTLIPRTQPFALWLLGENRLVELLTFIFLILGGIQGLFLAQELKRRRIETYIWGFYLFISLGLLLAGMEEISWGQWFLGFRTPQSLSDINTQGEFTLHNLKIWRDHLEVFPLLFGVGGMIGIWFSQRPTLQKIAPSHVLLSWFAIIAGLSALDLIQDFFVLQTKLDSLLNDLDELIEMFVGVSGFLFIWLNARALGPESDMVIPPLTRLITAIKISWSARLWAFLISLDVVFIALHILYTFTNVLQDSGFSLETDQGYGEVYQYFKWVGILLLLGALYKKKRAFLYLHWLFLFSYLFLDDALLIHETAGAWLATLLQLPSVYSLQGYDLGELIISAFAGFFFLTTLLLSYPLSEPTSREVSQNLIIMLAGLAFIGVFGDLIHAMAKNAWLSAWLGVAEDGGELILVSLITWFLAQRTAIILEEQNIPARVQTAIKATALFGLIALLFGLVQFSIPGFADNDGYYHAKMGLLFRQEGFKPTPPHLPLTILNEEDFYDHHFLYHAYLSLFAWIDPEIDGGIELTRSIKTASIWLPSLAFLAIWWLLRKQNVAWASIWTVGLFALSGDFLYRMSMPRTQSASLLILVLGFHWLLQKRYHLLAFLGFIYVWFYNAFPLLMGLAGVYFLVTWMTERRADWKALAYPALGIGLGLLINPYFPKDILFIFHHFLPKLTDSATLVGVEWYPYDTWTLVQDSGWAVGIFLVGVFAMGWQEKRPDRATLTAFLLTILLGIMLFKARRFIEYFPAFALIFTALATRPLINQWHEQRPFLKRWWPAFLIILMAFPLVKTIQIAQASMRTSDPADQYSAATLWLKVYSEPGSTVFQLDWDDFPRLFFYDSDKIYTVGLDPTFMELRNPNLYTEWVGITQGKVQQPSELIREDFDGDYVFSDLNHQEFLIEAFEDPGLEEIYRDKYAIIFKITENGDN